MASQRTFRLTEELNDRLEAEAKRQGRSVSNLIVWALVRELGSRVDLSEKIKELEPAEGVGNPVGSNIVGRRTGAANVRATGVGTPLPKIAPRRQPR